MISARERLAAAPATRRSAKPTSGMVLNSGSWTIVPKTHHHYATCVKDSVVAVYGIGPFKLNWLTMK